jgi:Beta-propeller repeat
MVSDRVGNSLKSAKSLSSKSASYKEAIGTADVNDLYRFTASSGSYNMKLSTASKKSLANVRVFSLKGNAQKILKKLGKIDLKNLKPRILKKRFSTVAQTTFDRRRPTELNLNLAPGDYYIQVASRKGNTAYNLNLSRTEDPKPIPLTVPQIPYTWLKQSGDKSNDYAYGTTTDAQGNLYVAGTTTVGSTRTSFVASYNPNGDLLWQRKLDLPGADIAFDVAVDGIGSYYVVGTANITGTKSDGYVAKYDRDGNGQWQQIIAGAPIGTDTPTDAASGVALDSAGNVFVSGFWNVNPSAGQFGNAFVAKFNGSSGASVAEFGAAGIVDFGGAGVDAAAGVAIDAENNVYLTGITDAALGFSTKKPYVDGNAFLSRFSGVSGALLWSQTLAGDAGQDYARSLALDSQGNVYIAGQTQGTLPSGSLPANVRAGKGSDIDAFVAKYSKAGDRLWVRQLGTSGLDEAQAIAVDAAGKIYVTGETTKAFLGGTAAGKSDAWMTVFDSDGIPNLGSQVGTAKDDETYGITVDSTGNVYITGQTYAAFPGATNAGKYDFWIAKYAYPLG